MSKASVWQTLADDHPDIYQNLSRNQHRSPAPQKQWNVQLELVRRGKASLRYLARFAQRSAFAPGRLPGYDANGQVLMRWANRLSAPAGSAKVQIGRRQST